MEFLLSKEEKWKIVKCDGIVLPNGDVMKEVDKEGYTYLGIVELDKIKENEMKEKKSNKRLGSGHI